MSNIPSSNKNHTKKTNNSRDRDKNKSVASESGGSSQCETPPLIDKDGGPSQGRFAGIGPDSIICMAEQVGAELNAEAATNLAEDVSYKLRQTISTLALHSEMLKKSRVDAWDVNSVLMLSDTSPVVGACGTFYSIFGEDKLCCPVENLLNVTEYALTTQSYVYSTLPTVSVEWITDDRSLNNAGNISVALQNYYTKVARAILNLRRKPKELAVQDLMTNTRIGPIFPNLFNLAVLVLNDDNLNALNVPAKKPLQANVLDMVDALCSNPCSLDTNIQQQFQRLFPVMVSNILGNGSLAEKMVAILTKIIRTWPSFIAIGKSILFDYLSQGTKERLTAPMIKCVAALGRRMVVECLGEHLDHLDRGLHPTHPTHATHATHTTHTTPHAPLRDAILDASTCLLRSEPTTYLEDFVTTDYTLYEMLGDSIMPRRLLFPYTDTPKQENTNTERSPDEEFSIMPLRPIIRRPKLRLVPPTTTRSSIHRDLVFEPSKFKSDKCIQIKVRNCRTQVPRHRIRDRQPEYASLRTNGGVVVASGLLNRFKCRLDKTTAFPIFGALLLFNGCAHALYLLYRVWDDLIDPEFSTFYISGKSILFDYLSQGTKERLTAPMIKCVAALGRRMVVECLGEHLDHLDRGLHPTHPTHATHATHTTHTTPHAPLRDAILDASTCLLRSEPTTYLEDFVTTDYTLYEMLGDSIMPRRLLFPYTDTPKQENTNTERSPDEEFSIMPLRPIIRRPKLRLVPPTTTRSSIHRDLVFEPSKFKSDKCIQIKIRNCRTQVPRHRIRDRQPEYASLRTNGGVVVASGLLNRFKCRLDKTAAFPIFGALLL